MASRSQPDGNDVRVPNNTPNAEEEYIIPAPPRPSSVNGVVTAHEATEAQGNADQNVRDNLRNPRNRTPTPGPQVAHRARRTVDITVAHHLEEVNGVCCPSCLCCFNGHDRRPKQLPCGHTSCSSCIVSIRANADASELNQVLQAAPMVARCPVCRMELSYADVDWPEPEPLNHMLDSALHMYRVNFVQMTSQAVEAQREARLEKERQSEHIRKVEVAEQKLFSINDAMDYALEEATELHRHVLGLEWDNVPPDNWPEYAERLRLLVTSTYCAVGEAFAKYKARGMELKRISIPDQTPRLKKYRRNNDNDRGPNGGGIQT